MASGALMDESESEMVDAGTMFDKSDTVTGLTEVEPDTLVGVGDFEIGGIKTALVIVGVRKVGPDNGLAKDKGLLKDDPRVMLV